MKKLLYLSIGLTIYQLTLSIGISSGQTVKLYTKAGVLKGTYAKIADAFLAAGVNDSVLLSPHIFYEHTNGAPGKNLVLQGTITGKDTSTVDAQGLGSCVNMDGIIRDVVITGATGSGAIRTFGKCRLTGNTVIRNNEGNSSIIYLSEMIIDGNVRIINNKVTTSSFEYSSTIAVEGNLSIRDNVVISGNDGWDIGAIVLPGVNKGDTTETEISTKLTIEGNVRIENNTGKRASALLFSPVGRYAQISGATFINNHCTNPGYGAAAIVVDSAGTGLGPAAIAGKDTVGFPFIRLSNCRIYNPLPDGSRSKEVWLRNEVAKGQHKAAVFTSESCWWGKSDTTGIYSIEDDGKFKTSNWAVTNWFCLPMSKSSTSVISVMRLNTGASLPPNALKGLEGKFFATAGTFATPSSTITSANVVASDYTYPSSGTFAVTAVIDADTFRPTTKMLGIKEQGFDQVKIYPNPATDVINISGAEEGSTLTLFDVTGKLVKQGSGTSGQVTVMDVSKLAPGNYILKIKNKDGGEGTAKVLVE